MNPQDHQQTGVVFTIGHSNHALARFLDLLVSASIDVLVDTRSHPRSQFAPHFNADALQEALASRGIKYRFLGGELGGRPADPSLYDRDGYALYSKIAQTECFALGISQILQGRLHHRIALLCSEENPSICHRRLLVARVLTRHNVPVVHIRGDGSRQSEDQLAQADLDRRQPNLFGEAEPTVWRSVFPILRKGRSDHDLH